jgi:hypothetical protein
MYSCLLLSANKKQTTKHDPSDNDFFRSRKFNAVVLVHLVPLVVQVDTNVMEHPAHQPQMRSTKKTISLLK